MKQGRDTVARRAAAGGRDCQPALLAPSVCCGGPHGATWQRAAVGFRMPQQLSLVVAAIAVGRLLHCHLSVLSLQTSTLMAPYLLRRQPYYNRPPLHSPRFTPPVTLFAILFLACITRLAGSPLVLQSVALLAHMIEQFTAGLPALDHSLKWWTFRSCLSPTC